MRYIESAMWDIGNTIYTIGPTMLTRSTGRTLGKERGR